jgi:hypothetical protein
MSWKAGSGSGRQSKSDAQLVPGAWRWCPPAAPAGAGFQPGSSPCHTQWYVFSHSCMDPDTKGQKRLVFSRDPLAVEVGRSEMRKRSQH